MTEEKFKQAFALHVKIEDLKNEINRLADSKSVLCTVEIGISRFNVKEESAIAEIKYAVLKDLRARLSKAESDFANL